MAKDDIGGVWRTIGGRRVFIKDGQSLADAMIESGKFKNLRSDYRKAKEEIEKEDKKTIHTTSGDYTEKELKERDEQIKQMYKDSWDGKMSAKDLHDKLEEMKKEGKVSQGELSALQYDASNESRTSEKERIEKIGKEVEKNLQDQAKKVSEQMQKNPVSEKEYEEFKKRIKQDNERKEREENGLPEKEKIDWKSQIEKNNAQMEKDVTDLQNKINEYRTRSANAKDGLERYQLLKEAERLQDQYYERFRENERANAKIKVEEPNEKYMNVEAYAGYKEKFNETWGKDGSNDKVVSAKMYTNDEFMEHLEDANWHSERKELLNANLTNQQLSYIKDRTKVSAWGVENLTGKEQVSKLINEAKSKNNSISNSLQRSAYNKYLKEHPNSKMTFEDFKKEK